MNRRCEAHQSAFALARSGARMNRAAKRAWLRELESRLPRRHAALWLAREVCGEKTTVAGRRNVYRLTSSASARSLEKCYERMSELESDEGCSLEEDGRHVARRVWSNYTRGDATSFVRESARLTGERGVRLEFLADATTGDDEEEEDENRADFAVNVSIDTRGATLIRLLDFAFADGGECWNLWCFALNQAIDAHDSMQLWPFRDSVTAIGVLAEGPPERETYRFVHEHGLTTKMTASLALFVRAFRRLMHVTVIACCFAVKRGTRLRTAYTKRHECSFPAMSQGVYTELFMTSAAGHELLCLDAVRSRADAVAWLRKWSEALRNVTAARPVHRSELTRDRLRALCDRDRDDEQEWDVLDDACERA